MKIHRALLAVAAAWAFDASATAVDWGVHDPIETATRIAPVRLGVDGVSRYGIDSLYGAGTYEPGDYFLKISGTTTGLAGGQYVLISQLGEPFVPGIPEPSTLALALAGLGVIAAGRRRQAQPRRRA